VDDDLVLLELDPDRVGPSIRWEVRPGAAPGEAHPHLYRPLQPADVISVQTLRT
jgi:uncharacterized protein (DUF952 family)